MARIKARAFISAGEVNAEEVEQEVTEETERTFVSFGVCAMLKAGVSPHY